MTPDKILTGLFAFAACAAALLAGIEIARLFGRKRSQKRAGSAQATKRRRPMKKLLIVLLLAAVLCGGCSGVLMSPKYTAALDKSVALSDQDVKRADAGTFTPEDMKASIHRHNDLLHLIQDARDGKESK